jgi:hypothetical protein
MTNLKVSGKNWSWTNFKHCPGIWRLRKTMKKPSQYSRSPSRDIKHGPSEYEAGILTTRPGHSVMCVGIRGCAEEQFSSPFLSRPKCSLKINTLASLHVQTEKSRNRITRIYIYKTVIINKTVYLFQYRVRALSEGSEMNGGRFKHLM